MSFEEPKHHREDILASARRYGATNVRFFGSVARGEAVATSDVDFLVDLEANRSLFDLAGLLHDLQQLLGVGVDIVTANALHWYIRNHVLSEAKSL